DVQTIGHVPNRLQGFRAGFKAQGGLEAEQPQHSQWVVGKGDLRFQRRSENPAGQIDRSPIGVDGFYLRERYGHGVDGEVPAGEVDLDVVGELDAGLTRIVAVDLLAESGHFNPVPVLDGADRAEGLPDGIDRASPTG